MATKLEIYPQTKSKAPYLRIVNRIPNTLNPRAIERAVDAFILESHVKGDPNGVRSQMLENIANSTFLGGNGHFWLAEHSNGEVGAFLMAHITKDVDNQLTYWVSSAWVHPEFRGTPVVKIWWEMIRMEARKCFCRHIVIVSSRNEQSYERFLGHGMEHYASLLMEDLEDSHGER